MIPRWLRATLDGLSRGEGSIRLHPEGFAQVELDASGDLRLHVWHPAVPRLADRDVVHDHAWDLESEVLAGRVENWVYQVREDEAGDWALWEAERRRSDGGSGKPGAEGGSLLRDTGRRFWADPTGGQFAAEGMTYRHPALDFHRSVAVGPTATVMRKSGRVGGHTPRVLARLGQSPDRHGDPGRPTATEAELWAAVYEVLGL